MAARRRRRAVHRRSASRRGSDSSSPRRRRGRPWWSGAAVAALPGRRRGHVASPSMLALIRATRRGGEFVRTPKHQIVRARTGMARPGLRSRGRPARDRRGGARRRRRWRWCHSPRAQGQWLVAIYSSMFAARLPDRRGPERGRLPRGADAAQPRPPRPGAHARGRARGWRCSRSAALLLLAAAQMPRAVRGRLRPLADRRQPGLDRAAARPALRHGGHVAARLPRAGGGGAAACSGCGSWAR